MENKVVFDDTGSFSYNDHYTYILEPKLEHILSFYRKY
jgi:hypothetical protein